MPINPFLLSPTERLSDWRLFRQSLMALPEQQQLTAVARYWSQAPLSRINYDPDQCPTIWQMLHANQWSRDTVAIGMEATLRLAGMAASRMTLRLIRDASDELLILVIDDTWALNYDWGSLRPYSMIVHSILRQWQFAEKDYFTLGARHG